MNSERLSEDTVGTDSYRYSPGSCEQPHNTITLLREQMWLRR
jgi:hypothetical protein